VIGVVDRTRPLKTVVARGAINNLIFAGGGSVLSYVQALIVMRIVGPDQIGLFAIGSAVALTMESVSDFGIGDRLVQEDGRRLQQTYNCAVVLHLLMAFVLWLFVWFGAALTVRIYSEPQLKPLIRAMSYSAFAGFLRLPLSLLYRDLKYFEQRLLICLGRVVGFVVAIACAVGGLGVWSLVFSGMVTLLVTSIPAWVIAPIRFRWRFPLAAIPSMLRFASPVWFAKVTYVGVQQGGVLALSVFLPLAVVGQFKSSEQIASIIFYIEVVLGQTLYPALCRIQTSPVEMAALFSKAARVSMSWIAGGAVALIVFADDIVRVVLSEKWAGAEIFLRAQGVALLFGALIYNWDVLFKASDDTRPIFVMSLFFTFAFALFFVPPLYFGGKNGAALGLVLVNAVVLISRKVCINRLHVRISLLQIAWRALLAAAVAGAMVLPLRGSMWAQSASGDLLSRLAAYAVLYACGLAWLERHLITEMFDVLRLKRQHAVYGAPVIGGSA